MTKNTIGQFIAALRKAKGMTQQDVADRLNVSNKAVSRWERDECAPDISLIPAIAEMFDITCDELLKGERIFEPSNHKKEPKVEKQIKHLVIKTISGLKTLNGIAIAVATIGLVFMYGFSYGLFLPVVGFFVMLLFEIIATVITIYSIIRAKNVKEDNELYEMADQTLRNRFNTTLSSVSFHSFFIIFSVVLLSAPLILYGYPFVHSVISIGSYLVFLVGIALILTFIYLKVKPIYLYWIIYNELPSKEVSLIDKQKYKMSKIQNLLTIIASLIFVYSHYLQFKPSESLLFDIAMIIGILCLVINMIYFISTLIKQKVHKKEFAFIGIRNILFIPAALLISKMHYVGWTHAGIENEYTIDLLERYDVWKNEYLTYAIVYVVIVYLVFSIVEIIKNKF